MGQNYQQGTEVRSSNVVVLCYIQLHLGEPEPDHSLLRSRDPGRLHLAINGLLKTLLVELSPTIGLGVGR